MTFYGQTYDLIYLSLVTEHKRYKNKRAHLNTSSLYLSISLKKRKKYWFGSQVKQFRIFIIYTSFGVDIGILVLLKRFLQTLILFLHYHNYIPFEKSSQTDAFCQGLLNLEQSVQRRSKNVKCLQTDGQTNGQKDGRWTTKCDQKS